MYEKLIKSLRVEPFEVESIGLARTMNEAADAIEELIKESARWQEKAKDWYLAYMNLLPTRDGYERGKADAEAYLLHYGDTDEPQTIADRIRSMTDEELAELMREITDPVCPPNHGYKHCRDGECRKCWLDWLKQEADG